MKDPIEQLKTNLNVISDLQCSSYVLNWDQQTYMPPGGAEARAFQMSTLRRLSHERMISDAMYETLHAAKAAAANLDPDSYDARLVAQAEYQVDKLRPVPSEWIGEFYQVVGRAHNVWEQAKSRSDFTLFQPHLEKIVRLRKQFSDFFQPYDHVYDPLLNEFERGMKTAQVKAVFDQLRPEQTALVQAIVDSGVEVDDSPLYQPFVESRQWDFGVQVISDLGYEFERGRQDKAAHPFTSSFSPGDVRITTRFDPTYLGTGLFSSIHEAGHALYDQGMSQEFLRTPLFDGASYGIHESQSRMMENLVGRSKPFWKGYLPVLQQHFPSELGEVDLERFYRAINKVKPSLIRTEADEATYNLHIMIRFDLEIDLLQGDLEVADLPAAWNGKMEEYLGLTPPDHTKGVLQDVHWSSGYFGYFPTYALGNLMASQIWEVVRADLPGIDQDIEQRKFQPLREWLREKVHRHGAKYEPVELLRRVTGEGLNPQPFMDYLEGKFGEIYHL